MEKGSISKFALWIFGYQKFSEELIRACVCREKGWKDVTGKVTVPKTSRIIENLEAALGLKERWPALWESARKSLNGRSKGRRIVLDAVFLNKSEEIVIAEFKSWKGWGEFDPGKLNAQLQDGKLFPERLAIEKVEYEGAEVPVTRFVVATNIKGHLPPEWEICPGRRCLEVLDIGSLLRHHGKALGSHLLSQLRLAVREVERYVETGEVGE